MRLSIIVIFHDMRREAARTLHSLSTAYQRGVSEADYEVIAVDNASAEPLPESLVTGAGPNFRLIRHETTSVSPVEAVNLGVAAARGAAVAIIVDGARMASPGLVGTSLQALNLAAQPVVYARSWHLGPDVQNRSILEGYDQAREDALLAEANWQDDGYRLFDISTLAQTSAGGFFGPVPSEFSWVVVARELFEAVEGFDVRFTSPGGGLVNQHFRNRVLARPGVTLVQILGEGVFHQVHGGVATNVPMKQHPVGRYRQEYMDIIGEEFAALPVSTPLYIGSLSEPARRFLQD
ncbi:glycosyltransferase family 2 protein [Salipiger mangrovisoli]|uniref:Glycosyltransferase n=1 Tax=Salipiger mangrovisoli TaxID=2865933 RepID=A0ABR9XBB7_9RHOB|nr:glycosyltransferase [Salipiger mangrovisoli]MBE9640903.1 glycosyltransferase [Salipiger mangrovisoli]